MGGGIMLVPALTLLGMDIKQAIAITMVAVIATSSGAASAYVRDRITNLKIGMFLEVFTIVGALAGATITLSAPPRPLYILFGLVLLASWASLFARPQERWRQTSPPGRMSRWLELNGTYEDRAARETITYHATRAYIGGPL
ncbi:MAG TPA: sulfite exporter TauE/SafE family protein, partial [bacterium]|nr:sulfite exporter TauE/SafE family protein [bacterium]